MDLGPDTGMAFTAHNFDGFSPDGSPAAGYVLAGTPGPDELVGASGADTITGLAGDDSLYGRAGADAIDAGAGNDLVEGGPGADSIQGGEGDDFLYGGQGDDVVHGGAGNDWLDDTDFVHGGGSDALHGDAGDDTLILVRYQAGPAQTHHLSGGEGNDWINAGLADGGTLIIDGGAGDDRVTLAEQRAGAGAIVTLGAGRDLLETAGANWDPFDSSLRITDFEAGQTGDRLDFSASHLATALASGQSRTVGIVLPTLRSWYFSEFASGASEILSPAGFRVELINLDVDSDFLEVDSPQFRTLFRELGAGRGRDALLFAGTISVERTEESADSARVPVSAAGSPLTSVPGIFVDNRAGGRLIAEHLLSLGHRHIAIFDGRMSGKPDYHVWDQRTDGLSDTLREAGIDIDTRDVIQPGDCHAPDGERAMKQLLATATASDSDLLPFR